MAECRASVSYYCNEFTLGNKGTANLTSARGIPLLVVRSLLLVLPVVWFPFRLEPGVQQQLRKHFLSE